MRYFFVSFCLLLLINCNNAGPENGTNLSDTTQEFTDTNVANIQPSIANKETSFEFRIIVENENDAGPYKQLVHEADSLLNDIINSPAFKNEVLAHNFDWIDLGNGRSDSVTNQQVFDSLYRWTQAANIKLHFKKLKLLNLGARYYGTAGKTIIGSNATTTYTNWLNLSPDAYQCTLLSYTSHIAHEYCHQRGFWDKNYNQDTFRDVIPYAIGDIICNTLNKRFNTGCKCGK